MKYILLDQNYEAISFFLFLFFFFEKQTHTHTQGRGKEVLTQMPFLFGNPRQFSGVEPMKIK